MASSWLQTQELEEGVGSREGGCGLRLRSGLWLCVRVLRKSRGLAGQVSSSSLEAPESPEHLEEWVWAKGEDLEEGAERARG